MKKTISFKDISDILFGLLILPWIPHKCNKKIYLILALILGGFGAHLLYNRHWLRGAVLFAAGMTGGLAFSYGIAIMQMLFALLIPEDAYGKICI